MAWLSTTEALESRRMRLDGRLGRVYTRVYRIHFDAINIDPLEALFAQGVPRIYESYITERTYDLGSIAMDIEPEQDKENPFFWLVRVEYQSSSLNPALASQGQGSGSNSGAPPNEIPFNDPPQVSWQNVHDNENLERDALNGNPIETAAGQQIAPRPTADKSRLRLVYRRNEATFNEADVLLYVDHVNSRPYRGFAPGQVKVTSITGEQQYRNRFPFWSKTYILDFRDPDWKVSYRNKGTLVRPTAGARSTTKLSSGLPIPPEGVDLEVDGTLLPNGTNPRYLNFSRYEEVDITPLHLNF